MKKIGIVGGVGWPSTLEYYQSICEASQNYHADKVFSGPVPMPEIAIESLNLNFSINIRGSSEPGSWDVWEEYFNRAIRRLEISGAEIIAIASVTPHTRLKEISTGIKTNILSVYSAIGQYCNILGIGRMLVLGTMPTMTSTAFILSMEKFGVKVCYPPEHGQKNEVVDIIGRLYQHKIQGTAHSIEQIVRQCVPEKEFDDTVVCLGCPELPLAFENFQGKTRFEAQGITYINSSAVNAKAIFEACVS